MYDETVNTYTLGVKGFLLSLTDFRSTISRHASNDVDDAAPLGG